MNPIKPDRNVLNSKSSTNPIHGTHDTDLTKHSWCVRQARDSAWRQIPTPALETTPGSTENTLVADTLSGSRTIRAMQTFIREKPSTSCGPEKGPEVRYMISLGSGVDGVQGTCHGGLTALLLDEVCGDLAAVVFGGYVHVTAELKVQYKRRLATPAVVLCRAWLVEDVIAGRKAWIDGTVEDGQGGAYATARALFVKPKPKI